MTAPWIASDNASLQASNAVRRPKIFTCDISVSLLALWVAVRQR